MFIDQNGQRIDVEIWGEKPHGHDEEHYAYKKELKEFYNSVLNETRYVDQVAQKNMNIALESVKSARNSNELDSALANAGFTLASKQNSDGKELNIYSSPYTKAKVYMPYVGPGSQVHIYTSTDMNNLFKALQNGNSYKYPDIK